MLVLALCLVRVFNSVRCTILVEVGRVCILIGPVATCSRRIYTGVFKIWGKGDPPTPENTNVVAFEYGLIHVFS